MPVQAYLNFNGNCREAVEFYAAAYNTELQQIMTFGDVPPNPEHPLPEEAKSLVLHTYLMISGSKIMFSDVLPHMSFEVGNNISLAVISSDEQETRTYFDAVKEGGTIMMELQETFWSKCYGIVKDKFGVEWQISTSDEEQSV